MGGRDIARLPALTPQGGLLLIKGAAGVLTGLLVSRLYPSHLTGFQAFYLCVVIYILVSMATAGIARRAKPSVSVSLYALFKGLATFFISLYLTLLSLHVYSSWLVAA